MYTNEGDIMTYNKFRENV